MSDVSEYSAVSRVRRELILRALPFVTSDSEVAAQLASIAKKAFRRGRGLLDGHLRRGDEESARRELTPERRHALLSALIPDLDDDKLVWRAMRQQPPLVDPSDLVWFAEHATATGDGPHESIFAKLSAGVYMYRGYPEDPSTIESVLVAFDTSPTFRAALQPFLGAVDPFQSAAAADRRANWASAQRPDNEPDDRDKEESVQRRRNVDALLSSIEDGRAELWPNVYLALIDQRAASGSRTRSIGSHWNCERSKD